MAIHTAQFNITPDQVVKITDHLKYQITIKDEDGNDIPNPQTRKLFLYGKIKAYLRECYRAQASLDGEVARDAALAQAEIDLANLEVTEA